MSAFQCRCGIPYAFAQYTIVKSEYRDVPYNPATNNISDATHWHILCERHAAFIGEPENIVGCGQTTVVVV